MSAINRNVTKMENDLVHKHDMAETQTATKRKRLIRRLACLIVLACATTYFMVSALLTQASALEEKEAEMAKLQQDLGEIKKEQKVLKGEIVKLNDDEYIAKIARRDYFLSEKNEIIFNIPDK